MDAYYSHFLVATPAEAAAGAESVPLDGFQRVTLDFVEGTAISLLQRLLTGQEAGPFECVHVWKESHGPWLYQLPDVLVVALASLERGKIPELAARWTESLEKEFEPFEDDLEVTPGRALTELVRLAQLAKAQGKQLYWKAPGC